MHYCIKTIVIDVKNIRKPGPRCLISMVTSKLFKAESDNMHMQKTNDNSKSGIN